MVRFPLLPLLSLALAATGCAALPGGPSLSPRAAEAIDPRLPVVDTSLGLPADPALIADLTAIRARALAAATAAEPALRSAAGVVAGAGPAQSESWVLAQQSLSAAIAARAPFTTALGDLDARVAAQIRSGGALVPNSLAALRRLSNELGTIDARQAGELAALQARLQR